MDIKLSQRATRIQPSATLAVAQKASELKAAGKEIFSLSTGEPDFDTPDFIKQAAIFAVNEGYSKYTPVDGLPSLKEAVLQKFKRDNKLNYASNEILVSCGAKHSLYNLMQALLDEGSEVIIPAPYWVSYPDMVRLAGGKPIIIDAAIDQHYKITAEQLEAAITSKTKLLILNSPSNPTGQVYSIEELESLAEVLDQYPHVLICTDDIYEHIQWTDEAFVNILNAAPELADRTVVVNGVSKAYAMTGWRIGYAAGPAKLIAAMKKIQSQCTSNPTTVAQKAAEAALNGPQHAIQSMLKAYQTRHQLVFNALQALPDIEVLASQGTFYSFPDITAIINKLPGINNDIDFAEQLIANTGVAVVPGSAFGMEGAIRLSYATSDAVLKTALERLSNFVK